MRMKPHHSKNINQHAYAELKQYIHKKDGLHHILLLTAFSKIADKPFECEERLTEQLDDFIVHMQKDGYELLDVKVSPISNSQVIGTAAGYSIVIVYQ